MRYQYEVTHTCGHTHSYWLDSGDDGAGVAVDEWESIACPDCDPNRGGPYYIVTDVCGVFNVMPAEGLFHCRLEQIVEGFYSSALTASMRIKELEVEYMLGAEIAAEAAAEPYWCSVCGKEPAGYNGTVVCAMCYAGSSPAAACPRCGEQHCDCRLPWE